MPGSSLWPESVDAVPVRGGPARRRTRSGSSPARRACRSCSAATRSSAAAPERYYNSAFLVRAPTARIDGVYRKMHLVPFGEYVPLKRLLFFAAPLVRPCPISRPARRRCFCRWTAGRISTAICYEIVYPNLVRRFVAGGSELLTTITNDAWFGRTSAPYQHFAQAAMRAIENGRYLVRAANTGISGVVDPVRARPDAELGLFEPASFVGEARYLKSSTLYTRTGDVFAYTSAVASSGDADRRPPGRT